METTESKPKTTRSKSKPEYYCVDFGTTSMSKFPSTAEKAGKNWTDYLNQMAQSGYKFHSVFYYALGVELNRKMIVFQKE